VEILTTMAVGIWDSILRSNRLGYVGRWPLTHLRYEKKLPNKDRPHSIVIRTATPEVVTAWDEEGSPRRRGLAQRRFSYRRKCTEGTLIWLRIECIERYPAPNQIECRSPEFYLKVLMHELGHALGLPESTARHSVMYPIISEYDTRIWLGADTRRRLNRYYSAGL
jgi:predicted Zn-dependent protease